MHDIQPVDNDAAKRTAMKVPGFRRTKAEHKKKKCKV